jgi:hypothetical protein
MQARRIDTPPPGDFEMSDTWSGSWLISGNYTDALREMREANFMETRRWPDPEFETNPETWLKVGAASSWYDGQFKEVGFPADEREWMLAADAFVLDLIERKHVPKGEGYCTKRTIHIEDGPFRRTKNYNTDTAKEVAFAIRQSSETRLNLSERLYLKRDGEYFLWGHGFNHTPWHGFRIIPLTVEEAALWLNLRYMSVELTTDIDDIPSDLTSNPIFLA